MKQSHWTLLLFYTASFIAVSSSVSAQSYSSHPEPLQPRIDAGGKVGTERNIGMMEGWMPLAQDDDSVLYGDIRWMADDESNQEGNLGIGYRTMQGDHIVGVHGWIDRRRTDRGSNFHQVTGGIEFLKEDWDVKANAYVPLNKEKEYNTANIGQASPYLAGTGMFIDTNGLLVEEAQPGGDVELGYRLPVFETHLDAVRIYGGGYAFIGDRSDDVIGGRVRASVDVSPLLNVGARFQYDEPRGSQGFIEATLRFPFEAKKRFQQHGLRARMDESPERDIDIVTGAVVTDTGLRKEVINAESGQLQRVIHVDNNAAGGGNGSVENPFNTLAAAETAMLDNDVIYVHRGNGTITGQNTGFRITKDNVQFIGSGVDFVYDTDKFTTYRPGPNGTGGSVIIAATVAPVITNTVENAPTSSDTIGSGVFVTANNAVIAGFMIDGAQGAGVTVMANNTSIDQFKLHNTEITASKFNAVNATATNNGTIGDITLYQNYMYNNVASVATYIRADLNSTIQSVNILDNNFVFNDANIQTAVLTGGRMNNVLIANNYLASTERANGIHVQATNNGTYDLVTVRNNEVHNSLQNGINVTVSNFNPSSATVILEDNIVTNGAMHGINIGSNLTSYLTVSLSGNTATGNGAFSPNYYGINVDNDNTGTFNVDLGGGTLGSTGGNRIYNNVSNRDISIDSRPGTAAATPGVTISAQHNWWGVGTGLNQGTRANFDNGSASPGSSLDASNHLTTDPGL